MTSRLRRRAALVALAVALWAVAPAAFACTVCFGETDNDYLLGAEQAILFMVGVTYFMLMGGVGVFLYLRRRARRRATSGADVIPAFESASQPRSQGA